MILAPRTLRRCLAGTLALAALAAAPSTAAAQPESSGLSPETAPATPAPPSERDLAYELGIQAESSGDLPRAAAAFERAYRLTAPAETGPRLLFLRASVAARLRADDGSQATRVQLCHARTLLRDYLGNAAEPSSSEEQKALARIDARLALASAPDCVALLGTPPGPTPKPTPGPTAAPSAQPLPTPAPPPAGSRPPRADPSRPSPRTAGQRGLLASGMVSLGLAAGAFATMGVGIRVSLQANERGYAACREPDKACTSSVDDNISDLRSDGQRGNTLTTIGAAVGAVAVLAGVVLIVVGERLRRRPRVALTPHLAPGSAGLGLSGRF